MLKFTSLAIEFSFYALFFSVPLVLTTVNYELFEYNKMMLTYGLTVIILGLWALKSIRQRRFRISRTPFDIPLFLFLLSQIISTIVSIDRHVSIFGYYSRFHGGLLSTFSYITLFYAFVTNFPKDKLKTLLIITLSSAFLVASYGILEHFGIDANYWVQDVRNRVFSTLGQPNWLAAYLAVLIPIGFGLTTLNSKGQTSNIQSKNQIFSHPKSHFHLPTEAPTLAGYLLFSIYYLALLYTKSRSGFLGVWAGILIFAVLMFLKNRKFSLKHPLLLLFLITTFFVGSPFGEINKYFSLGGLQRTLTESSFSPEQPATSTGTALETGGTESGTIRRIVWKGAIDIFRRYPVFGSGVETFAFSYYKFRPVEHNMVSEWDFLYNKAHNEYLNFLATTGLFGLGAYLLFIISFIIWNLRQLKDNLDFSLLTPALSLSNGFNFALFTGWLTILVTNFFGFSVVVIGLLFFLIPAVSFLLQEEKTKFLATPSLSSKTPKQEDAIPSASQKILITTTLFAIGYLLFAIIKAWVADTRFARGRNSLNAGFPKEAFLELKNAIDLNANEPFYRSELSMAAADLALASATTDATLSANLAAIAISESEIATKQEPQNVSFYKTRTRVFYTLAENEQTSPELKKEYERKSLEAIEKAAELAPTDPKIQYNLGVLYDLNGQEDKAIAALEKTVKMKPDYREARSALALYYFGKAVDDKGKVTDRKLLNLAIEQIKYILENIDKNDAEAKERLEEWEKL